MSHRMLALVVFSILISYESVRAQNVQTMEYVTASSPLKNGGVVTSQSVAGQPIATAITLSEQPRAVVPTSGTVLQNGLPNISTGGASAGMPYPYPVVSPQLSYFQPQWRANNSNVLIPGSAMPSAAWQVPTLGITNNTVLRPNVLALNADSNAAATPPGINIEVPGGGLPAANSGAFAGGVPTIQYPSATSGVWNPYATNKYQPLIKLRNMPPGTYLGQGIVGQPKAYVDGQPMRNFLRYIFP